MESIPYLGVSAILRAMRHGAYLMYDGIGWLLFNAADEPAGATTTDVFNDLRYAYGITWETNPTRAGVRWVEGTVAP